MATAFDNELKRAGSIKALERELKMKQYPIRKARIHNYPNSNRVVMHSVAPAISGNVTPLPQYIPGEKPDKAHVWIPVLHSAVDGFMISFSITVIASALKYIGWMNALNWLDLFVMFWVAFVLVTVADWFIDNRNILHLHTRPEWIEPEPVIIQAPPEMPDAKLTVTNSYTQDKGSREYEVTKLLPTGWKWSKFRQACKAILDSRKFSEKGSGLSKDKFQEFRDSFFKYQKKLDNDLIWWANPENTRQGLKYSRDCKNILEFVAKDSQLAQQMKDRGF